MSERSVWKWAAWAFFAEGLMLLLALRGYFPTRLQRRSGREGNRLARLVMDDPGLWESLAFYLVLAHLVVGGLLLVAFLSARRKRAAGAHEEVSSH